MSKKEQAKILRNIINVLQTQLDLYVTDVRQHGSKAVAHLEALLNLKEKKP